MKIECTVEEWEQLTKKEPCSNKALNVKLVKSGSFAPVELERVLKECLSKTVLDDYNKTQEKGNFENE